MQRTMKLHGSTYKTSRWVRTRAGKTFISLFLTSNSPSPPPPTWKRTSTKLGLQLRSLLIRLQPRFHYSNLVQWSEQAHFLALGWRTHLSPKPLVVETQPQETVCFRPVFCASAPAQAKSKDGALLLKSEVVPKALGLETE